MRLVFATATWPTGGVEAFLSPELQRSNGWATIC
jgi:hypothetical protein